MARGQTPFAGGRTHFAGGQTLFAGGRTHFAGGQTPFAGGQTPFAGGQTPFAGGQTHFAGGRTPFAGGRTPFAGGRTLLAWWRSGMMGLQCAAMVARMRRSAWLAGVSTGVLLWGAPSAGRADPFPMGIGGAPGPLSQTQVVLAQEDLSLGLSTTEVRVSAKLDLHNPSDKPERLEVGFPCLGATSEPVVGLACSVRPAVSVAGKPVRLGFRRGKKRAGTWVWPMVFAKDQHVEVTVSYTVPLQNPRYQVPLAGAAAVYYRLTTGARWAQSIERLDIEVTTPVETLTYIAPPGYSRTLGRIRWHLVQHEPQEDVVIGLAPPETSRYLALLGQKPKAEPPSPQRDRELRGLATHFATQAKQIAESYTKFYGLPAIQQEHQLPSLTLDVAVRCSEESAKLIEQAVAAALSAATATP